MTDTRQLVELINSSGYKKKFISEKLNITYQGFMNKLNNKSEFKQSEIVTLCEILQIDKSKKEEIFFAKKVDEMATKNI